MKNLRALLLLCFGLMLAGTLAASEAGPDLLTPLVMSIRKDWPERVAILNKRLAAITQEEMAEPYRRWFGQGGVAPNRRVTLR